MSKIIVSLIAGASVLLNTYTVQGAVPQSPDQIAFNKGVITGSVLVVAEMCLNNGSTCMSTSAAMCPTIDSLQQDDDTCSSLQSGSEVRVLQKTNRYIVNDPTQPASLYTNPAHLVVYVVILVAAKGSQAAQLDFEPAHLLGKRGYINLDALNWPGKERSYPMR